MSVEGLRTRGSAGSWAWRAGDSPSRRASFRRGVSPQIWPTKSGRSSLRGTKRLGLLAPEILSTRGKWIPGHCGPESLVVSEIPTTGAAILQGPAASLFVKDVSALWVFLKKKRP